MDQQSFFLEFVEAELALSTKNRIQCHKHRPIGRIEKNKHIDIPGSQRFAMKAGGSGTADGISTYDPFAEELLKDVADVLHDCLSFSSCRVSWMNCPILSILSATGRALCFSRQRGMPRF